jgi:hypothetical protein
MILTAIKSEVAKFFGSRAEIPLLVPVADRTSFFLKIIVLIFLITLYLIHYQAGHKISTCDKWATV